MKKSACCPCFLYLEFTIDLGDGRGPKLTLPAEYIKDFRGNAANPMITIEFWLRIPHTLHRYLTESKLLAHICGHGVLVVQDFIRTSSLRPTFVDKLKSILETLYSNTVFVKSFIYHCPSWHLYCGEVSVDIYSEYKKNCEYCDFSLKNNITST